MPFLRSSGILLHPTSFPSRFGIGDLGLEAYRFVDFLAQSPTLVASLASGTYWVWNSPHPIPQWLEIH